MEWQRGEANEKKIHKEGQNNIDGHQMSTQTKKNIQKHVDYLFHKKHMQRNYTLFYSINKIAKN